MSFALKIKAFTFALHVGETPDITKMVSVFLCLCEGLWKKKKTLKKNQTLLNHKTKFVKQIFFALM